MQTPTKTHSSGLLRPARGLPRAAAAALVAATLATAAGCGTGPERVRPRLAEGDGRFTLRFNRPPPLTGNPDLYFEVQGPAGWERVSLENPDEELDLLTSLVALAERTPAGLIEIDGSFRRDTRAYGDHTARVLRVVAVPGLPPEETVPAPPTEPTD